MNHYMSYTGLNTLNGPPNSKSPGSHHKSSIYTSNASLRRSKKRRSTRSLHSSKSKANSMSNIAMRASSGSLRSLAKRENRKSATSLLLGNPDTSFNTNTIGSRGGGGGTNGTLRGSYKNMNTSGHLDHSMMSGHQSDAYQTLLPPPPPPSIHHHHQGDHHSSHYGYIGGGSSSGTSGYQQQQQQQHHRQHHPPPPPLPNHHHHNNRNSGHYAPKYLTSDSETDYYHTFNPPSYANNGLVNPLYGNRNSYLNDSETAIWERGETTTFLYIIPLLTFRPFRTNVLQRLLISCFIPFLCKSYAKTFFLFRRNCNTILLFILFVHSIIIIIFIFSSFYKLKSISFQTIAWWKEMR